MLQTFDLSFYLKPCRPVLVGVHRCYSSSMREFGILINISFFPRRDKWFSLKTWMIEMLTFNPQIQNKNSAFLSYYISYSKRGKKL